MRDGPGFRNGLVEKLDGAIKQRVGRLGAGNHVEAHLDADQVLTEAVVKFAGKFSPLFILHVEQTSGELTKRLFAVAGSGLGQGASFELDGKKAIVNEK